MMSRLMRDGTVEPVSRNQFLRRERVQGNIHFPCSAGHEQDWQPYPDDPHSILGRVGIRDDFVPGEVTKTAPSGDWTT